MDKSLAIIGDKLDMQVTRSALVRRAVAYYEQHLAVLHRQDKGTLPVYAEAWEIGRAIRGEA